MSLMFHAFFPKVHVLDSRKRCSFYADRLTSLLIYHATFLPGRVQCRSYAFAFLHRAYPRLPEEYVTTVVDYLLADECLGYIASTLGLKDLVLYSNTEKPTVVTAPPSCQILANALLAVVGLLVKKSVS